MLQNAANLGKILNHQFKIKMEKCGERIDTIELFRCKVSQIISIDLFKRNVVEMLQIFPGLLQRIRQDVGGEFAAGG